jgi:hypothetical protein
MVHRPTHIKNCRNIKPNSMVGGETAIFKSDTFHGHVELLGERTIITVIPIAQN